MPDSNEILKPIKNPRIYAYTEPQYEQIVWTGSRTGKGLVKVGYTERNARIRIEEQFPTNRPTNMPYTILLDESAIRTYGTFFKDFNVHEILERMGAKRFKNTEWFEATVDDVAMSIAAVKARKTTVSKKLNTFAMRPEQTRAVEITEKYFKEHSRAQEHRTPHFLWNAKMRFGKTFTAYQLAKRMGWKKILVLTFKPAVQSAWQEDIETHQDFQDWQFIHKDGELTFQKADKNLPIVWFASFQDMLGKSTLGGIKTRNEDIHTTNWDCVILDEYHFGAWREHAKELFDREEIDEDEYKEIKESGLEYYDEESMPITTSAYLYLSGTPFRAINSGEFLEDQIFSWTYSDEQRAKEAWGDSPDNPYRELPKMVLLTYQMPEEIRKVALKGEFNEFDLNEFFKAEKTNNGYEFKHKEEVQKWLNLIQGQLVQSEEARLRTKGKSPMPFSDGRLLSASHSIWYLPNVAACEAMNTMLHLDANKFFKTYKIVVCAGTRAGIGLDALPPVKEAIGNGFDTKTITLTCGKLLTGISIPQWSAILMLRNTTSPEAYFQSTFRVQTPWKLRNPDGKSPNEVQIIKDTCFVYDFAPDRALFQIATYGSGLNPDLKESPEKKVGEFIHFLPVLCYDGCDMKQLNAGEIMDLVVSGTASTMLARRWESALLVNVDNDTLRRIMNDNKVLEILEKIEGFRNLNEQISTILNKSDSLKKLKASEPEDDKEKKSLKKEISDEEKEIKSLRKKIQEKLLKFATRIPVFMYLTDYREETLYDIIRRLEPNLFKRVTGLGISDFDSLVSIGVFNSSLMNQAIFAFKRFEDASLSYTGIVRHKETFIGGWDTKITSQELNEIGRI